MNQYEEGKYFWECGTNEGIFSLKFVVVAVTLIFVGENAHNKH